MIRQVFSVCSLRLCEITGTKPKYILISKVVVEFFLIVFVIFLRTRVLIFFHETALWFCSPVLEF